MVRRNRHNRGRRSGRSRSGRAVVPRYISVAETRKYIIRYNVEVFSNTLAFQPTVVTVEDNPTESFEFAQLAPLYQMYRVNAIKIHYNPSYTVNQTSTSIDAYNRPVYCVHDTNDTLVPGINVNTLFGFQRLAIFNTLQPFSYYTRMKRRLNMSSVSVGSTDGYISTTSPIATQKIIMFIPGINLSALSYGIFTVSYYCSFKVRR